MELTGYIYRDSCGKAKEYEVTIHFRYYAGENQVISCYSESPPDNPELEIEAVFLNDEEIMDLLTEKEIQSIENSIWNYIDAWHM